MTTRAIDEHEPGSRSWFARLILNVRAGKTRVDWGALSSLDYESSTAVALCRAHGRSYPSEPLELGGLIRGDLILRRLRANLTLSATVHGDFRCYEAEAPELDVSGVIQGAALVDGRIVRDLWIDGEIRGDLTVRGSIGGSLVLEGRVVGAVEIWATVEERLRIGDRVESEDQKVGERVAVFGDIGGDVLVLERVGGGLEIVGNVTGGIEVAAPVGGDFRVISDVGRDLKIRDSIGGVLILEGRFDGRVTLTPQDAGHSSGPVVLASVFGAEFAKQVFVGDNVAISACDFRECPDLDQLQLVGAHLLPEGCRKLDSTPHDSEAPIPPLEMASINRQLRAGLESRKNRAASSFFYRGEMDARLEAARHGTNARVERWVLEGYRLTSLYGMSVWRPIAWFLVVALVGSVGFGIDGLDLDPELEPSPGAGWPATVTFSVRSMLSFLSPPEADLSTADEWIQIVLRFAGPALLAQALLGLRERLAR